MYFGAVDLLYIRYAVILKWFCPCFRGLFCVILWVLRVLGQGLNQRARIFLIRAFSGSFYGYNPALF